MAPLDNVRLKIKWAGKQFEILKSEIILYVKDNPGKFLPKRYSPAKDQAWGRFITESPVPPQISLLFGDVLLSIQSCLDYLIWELVESSRIEKPSIANQFPIVETRTLFEEEIGRKRLRGVPFHAIAIIEGTQPYHSPKGTGDSALFALKTLANIYKHRYLPLSALAARPAPPDISIFETDGILYADFAPIFQEPFNSDEEFGPFPVIGSQVNLERNFAMVIALSDAPYKGCEITSLLSWICTVVKDHVFPQFESFFV